jgi:hypothetical protein
MLVCIFCLKIARSYSVIRNIIAKIVFFKSSSGIIRLIIYNHFIYYDLYKLIQNTGINFAEPIKERTMVKDWEQK